MEIAKRIKRGALWIHPSTKKNCLDMMGLILNLQSTAKNGNGG